MDSVKLAEVFKGLREIFFDGTLLRWDEVNHRKLSTLPVIES